MIRIENSSSIKFKTKAIKSNYCDYSDAYILVTWGDITVTGDQNSAETNTEFKNCAPFTVRVTHINDEHIDTTEMLDIIISMYRLIEYSDNYSDISGRLRQFKRDESLVTNARNLDNVSKDN